MSGHPNKQQIAEMADQLTVCSVTVDRIKRINIDIEALIAEKERLNSRWTIANTEVNRLMNEMDITSPGNYGYEKRLLATLEELATGYVNGRNG